MKYKKLKNHLFLFTLLIIALLPKLSYAQHDQDFGKTKQQIKSLLATDPNCTFISEKSIVNGTVTVLWYYFESDSENCKKAYYFDKSDRMTKYAEIHPLEKLNDLLLFANNSSTYNKIDNVTWYNTKTKIVINIQSGSDYNAITYRTLNTKTNNGKAKNINNSKSVLTKPVISANFKIC